MKIKKGDNVVVLTGKDKGKKAKVLLVLAAGNRVLVEGVSLVKKRRRPKRSGEKGQTVEMATPISLSNVALWCNACGRGVRAGARFEDGRKIRVCVRCKGTI